MPEYAKAIRPMKLQGSKADTSSMSRISTFYHKLAVKLGCTMRKLEQQEKLWTSTETPFEPLPREQLLGSLKLFQEACDEKGLERPTRVLERAKLPRDRNTTNDEALSRVRTRIFEELRDNLVMLYPRRRYRYYEPDADGGDTERLQQAEKWDHNWDWASPTVRGERRQFWTLDRWPVGMGILLRQREEIMRNGLDIDALHVVDPAMEEEPTSLAYMRPRLRRYQDEKTKVRYGPAVYPVGDTALQEKRVQEVMTQSVARGKSGPEFNSTSRPFSPCFLQRP
jgi:hypothetical protein